MMTIIQHKQSNEFARHEVAMSTLIGPLNVLNALSPWPHEIASAKEVTFALLWTLAHVWTTTPSLELADQISDNVCLDALQQMEHQGILTTHNQRIERFYLVVTCTDLSSAAVSHLYVLPLPLRQLLQPFVPVLHPCLPDHEQSGCDPFAGPSYHEFEGDPVFLSAGSTRRVVQCISPLMLLLTGARLDAKENEWGLLDRSCLVFD